MFSPEEYRTEQMPQPREESLSLHVAIHTLKRIDGWGAQSALLFKAL